MYSGDGTYDPSTSAAFTVVVGIDTETSVAGPSTVTVGGTGTYKATVSAADSSTVSSGTVSFSLDTTPIAGCVNLSLTAAAAPGCTVTFATDGSSTINASYSGGGNYFESEINVLVQVNFIATTTTVTGASTVTVHGSRTYTATVTAGGAAVSTGTVTFASPGTCISVALNSSGIATCDVTFNSTGSTTILAIYSGDATHATSSGSASVVVGDVASQLVVSAPGSATPGTPFTVTATAKDSDGNVDTDFVGPLTLSSTPSGAVFGVVSWVEGVGSFTATMGEGTFTVTASYSGDTDFAGTSGSIHVTTASTSSGSTVPSAPVRLFGPDRFETAIAVSKSGFPAAGSAGAVVLVRSDTYPDALVGSGLAAAKNAPMLFALGGSLTAGTRAEIQRVLPAGGTVYVLGDAKSIPEVVATSLTKLGFHVVRLAGADRYATAVAVAGELGNPSTVFLATGLNFPDALAAAPAAAHVGGVVLLTAGPALPASVKAYLAAHPGKVYAVGGAAVAAYPLAIPLVGADRYETAALLASALFSSPTTVGVASGVAFPDATSGGAFLARTGGPLLLSEPSSLPKPTSTYLSGAKGTIVTTSVFGSTAALSAAVQTAIAKALGLELKKR